MTEDAGPEAEHLKASTYDNVDQLLLVLDQLALCRELLLANDPARARMALILLDNLADVLIYRHNRELIGGAQDRYAKRRFTRKQRAALQNSFEERLGLAQESAAFSWLSGGPLIDQDDVRVLRVVHFYRNSAYHRDSHKPALVGVLGRVLFATVCRMSVASYRPGAGFGSSSLAFAKQMERLNQYLDPPGIALDRHDMLVFRQRAEQATTKLSEGFGVERPVVTAAFSEDLKLRAAAALDLAQELASGGLDEERIRDGIAWADFWKRFGGDPDLIRYADESQSLRKEISDTRDPNWERIREADRKYSERIDQLRRGFKPQSSLDYIDEAEVAGDQIARAGSLAEVLEEYAVADRRMTALEDCLWEVADDRERQLDLQMQEWKETHRHEQLGRPRALEGDE